MEIIDFSSFTNVCFLSTKMKLILQNQTKIINFKIVKVKIRTNYKRDKSLVTKKNKKYL